MLLHRIMVGVGLVIVLLATTIAFGDMLYWLDANGGIALVVYASVVSSISWGLYRLFRNTKKPECVVWVMMAICLGVGVLTALIFDFKCGLSMVSDFASAQRAVEAGKPMIVHPGWCEYWCNYELVLSYLGMAIAPRLLVAQVLNVLCLTAAVYPVFKISCGVGGLFTGILVTMSMALSPALLGYSAFTTGEFVGAVFMIYAYYVASGLFGEVPFTKKSFVRICTCGILLGVSQLFKPLALISFGAFLVLLILGCLGNGGRSFRRFLFGVTVLVAMFVSYKVSLWGLRATMSAMNTTGVMVEAMSESPWKGLVVGLNIQSDGGWERSISDLAHRLTNDEARDYVLNRAKKEYAGYPKLILKKFVRLYQSQNWFKAWCRESFSDKPSTVFESIADGAFAFVHILFFGGIVGIILLFRGKEHNIDFFPLLIVAGFTAIVMLIEMQPRYRTSIFPFYFIVMGYSSVTWKAIAGKILAFRLQNSKR